MAINRNNMGTALRALGRYEEAVAEGRVAAETLEGEGDLTRAGEAYAELATTLAMSGAPTAQVRDTWLRSASCYEAAGAADKARESRAKAEGDADRADVEGGDVDRAKPDRADVDRAKPDRPDADRADAD
jgi:tetratricopeptide (TPR) repeat protein